jgi:NADPH-dependent ferric siderophore reductase
MSAREEPTVRAQNAELAARLGVDVWDLEVTEIVERSPSMRAITFACAPGAPETLTYQPGNDLTLAIATRGDAIVRRRYSIRRLDAAARSVGIEFVLHGAGPGGRWASEAAVGDRLEGIGPRGKIVLNEEADWHCFIADDAFIPAASAMIEALPEGATAYVFFEVATPEHDLELAPAATLGGPGYLYRDGTPPGRSAVLLDALGAFVPPPGRGQVYVGGEHLLVGAISRVLGERGVPPDQIASKAYWRLGRANGDHGEPPREE